MDTSIISYQGTVLSITSNRVELALGNTRQAACGTCAQRTGCLSADQPSEKTQRYGLSMPTEHLDIAVGDRVELQIPKKAFWMALLFAYLFPAVLAITAMFLAHYFLSDVSFSELWIAVSGIAGAVVGVVIASFVNRFFRPNLVRKIST